MKIIAIHLFNNFSGSPRILAAAIPALQAAGHEVELLTSAGPGFLDGLQGRKREVWYRWSPSRWGRLLHFTFNQLMLAVKLWRYRREDCVFLVNTLLPGMAGIMGRLLGKRVVWYVHETHIEPPPLNRLLCSIVQHTASEVLYVSRYLQQARPFAGIPARVIYNALPPEMAEAQPARPWTGEGRFEVLMVTSLREVKGLRTFVELAERTPEANFTLIISSEAARLREFFAGTVLPDNLTLLPAQADVRPFYQAAHLHLNLSHPIHFPETFGMTNLEAMAYGLPVIVPPVGAPPEYVTEGKEGFLRDARDLGSIQAAIRLLIASPQTHQQMGKAARYRALTFSPEAYAQAILGVFGEVRSPAEWDWKAPAAKLN